MTETKTEAKDLWEKVVSFLEGKVNRPVLETLLATTLPIRVDDGVLHIGVPNEFSKDWLWEKCGGFIEVAIRELNAPHLSRFQFVVDPALQKELGKLGVLPGEEKLSPSSFLRVPRPSSLNPRYKFDAFVVGHGNRFAHAAALAVAETPAKAYNPFFIYGGVGLGKTHLMQAIGNFVILHNPRARVLYVTSEQFTNELINSIRYDKTEEFRNRYRSIDVLLVDDVQFIAGKESTEQEFFHTFNALHESAKQIVVSSDRPPKDIPTLEERLRSRFEWGLTADIQAPDLETRTAILRKKAENEEIAVPDDVLHLIATKIVSNIRELEGALIRIIAYASLTGTDLTPLVAEDVLKDLLSPPKEKPITIDFIKKATAQYYSVKIDDMSAKTRTREIATARQVAMYICRELTPASLPKIGDEFGGRDHTTVMHACEKIKDGLKSDPDISEAVKSITKTLEKSTPR